MLCHGHTLSLEGVEGSDNLELECGTDPHCVGVHQLLDYEGARRLASTDGLERS